VIDAAKEERAKIIKEIEEVFKPLGNSFFLFVSFLQGDNEQTSAVMRARAKYCLN